ncbi:hypothetical protein [Streptomyces caelestis]|uniref:hypothetical protein n=1 Tax=Streptomyces caelestis TaxID=36816 RepID=UPI00364C3160
MFTALTAQADADEDLDAAVSVDSAIAGAHQYAVGARREGPWQTNPATMPSAAPATD